MSENKNIQSQTKAKEDFSTVNTHNHVDYGGDDAEHTLKPSKVLTDAQRKAKRIAYSGD